MALTKIITDGITDDAVTSGKIPANAVGTSEIASGAVTSTQIADNTIVAGDIADATITLAKLEHGTSSNDGKFLRANNGADPTFESIPAGITINNQGDNRIITATGTADTLNAESAVTIDGSGHLAIQGSGQRQLTIGSTDGSIAAIILDGNSNGDGAGGDYSLIRHTSSGDLDFFARDPSGATNYIFRTGSTEKVRFQAAGGISFNGDTAAANALDDYEEGSFTPYIGGSSTVGSWSAASANGGFYIKIGRKVTCWMNVQGTVSGAAGTAYVYGLPFASAATNTPSGSGNANYSVGTVQYWAGAGVDVHGALMVNGNTKLYFHTDNGSATGVEPSVANQFNNCHVQVSYWVA